MQIRGVLFDKDGTLVDFHGTWMPPYQRAAECTAAEAGKPAYAAHLLSAAGFDTARGRCLPDSPLACGTTLEIAHIWARELALDDAPALAARLDAVFALELRPAPVQGVAEALGHLRAHALHLGVATMDSVASARDTLADTGLADYMEFVCGCDSGHGHKPGPGMVQAFARYTGLPASAIAVVGDTPHDLNMARAAGAALAVGVLTGASPRDALAPLADHVLESVADLPPLLGLR